MQYAQCMHRLSAMCCCRAASSGSRSVPRCTMSLRRSPFLRSSCAIRAREDGWCRVAASWKYWRRSCKTVAFRNVSHRYTLRLSGLAVLRLLLLGGDARPRIDLQVRGAPRRIGGDPSGSRLGSGVSASTAWTATAGHSRSSGVAGRLRRPAPPNP